MPTASRDIVISNKLGLHARPAMQFVDLANSFASEVRVIKGGAEPVKLASARKASSLRQAVLRLSRT